MRIADHSRSKAALRRETDKIEHGQGDMTPATASAVPLAPAELDDRRLAVESTIGTMRIEGLEPDEATQRILARYARVK
jgi:hypothetical protein